MILSRSEIRADGYNSETPLFNGIFMTEAQENLFQHMTRLHEANIDPKQREEEIWDRYGRTVGVLILDSSGFSRVSESHGIVHFLSRLMLMRNITKPIFEANKCRELHFEADNIFAVFEHPDDAISTALEVHRQVHASGLMLTDDEPFKVCIGIGYGRMLYSETLEGYFSEEINFASKLGEDTAEGGETLLTDGAYNSASQTLVKDFSRSKVEVSGLQLNYYRHQFNT